ncbi:uncharacterized protein [Temnothorax longispinosus]|uniref:uncharacterized protein n=1 Tax=Temnothorax longispinosus TaxID=300112 RepID=UPI003A9A59FC
MVYPCDCCNGTHFIVTCTRFRDLSRSTKISHPTEALFQLPRPPQRPLRQELTGIIKPNIIKRDPLMPIAQLSIFGWLVLRPVDTSSSASAAVHHASIQEREDALDELLSKFWTQEEVPASTNHDLTPDEQRCEEYFKTTGSRDSTGQYTVRFPLKSSPDTLGDSYLTAHRCLQSLLRRLFRDNNNRRLYHQFMTEYRELNHMNKASPVSSQHTQYYLPHHGVLRPDSATTKLRVIRQFRHLVATDITKMYRQINVHEDDWNLQRILWIDELLNEVSYYLTTVTYGTKAAPFLAVRTLLQLVEDD